MGILLVIPLIQKHMLVLLHVVSQHFLYRTDL